MSAIGNYIHLTAAGYNRTGTNRQREGPSLDAATALSLEKDSIRQRIESYQSMNNLFLLEKDINDLLDTLGGRSELSETNSAWANQAIEFVDNYLHEVFLERLQDRDYNNLTVVSRSEKEKGIGKIKTNYQAAYADWSKTITKRVAELDAYMEKFFKNKTEDEYRQAIQKIKEVKAKLYDGTYQQLIGNGWKGEPRKDPLKISIKEINEIIKKYAAMPDLSTQSGAMFENVIPLIKVMGEEIISEELKKMIKAKDKFNIVIDESNFKDVGWNIKLNPDITQKGKKSQSKIDVAFEWNGQQLNISAKNYNLNAENKSPHFIKVLEGSNLLYLLQDENADFVNHYFNLYSKHIDQKGNSAGYTAQRRAYWEVLKLVILYKGITGDVFGRDDKANVFIINDSSGTHSTRVKVLSIADLLKKAMDAHSKNLGLTGDHSSIQNLYANKKVKNSPSGIARVATILNDAHARKIKASFNSALLDWD